MNNIDIKIGVIGLWYVGLPLAIEFSKKYPVLGFDINKKRVTELKRFVDETLEICREELQKNSVDDLKDLDKKLGFFATSNINNIKKCNFYVITVPTPVDKFNRPILTPLYKASETVGKVLKKGDYVVYESTVYPGATEEDCLPILERESGLKLNKDFF